ncbi:MAG: GWxTD domain-containing protein [candidate division Zixibacteria bacterium]|nr:GWxTD domain-containing protein [candidate division Zixibacteria bacterium]
MLARLSFLVVIAIWMLPGASGLSAGLVGNDLKVYSGVAVYANPVHGDLVRVEFSYSVNRNELMFFRPDGDDGNLEARVFAQIDIFDNDGRAVDSVGTYFTVSAADREDAARSDIRVFDKLSLELAPGTYSARLTVLDAANKSRGECFFDQVVVEKPQQQQLRISDVSLLYDISSVGTSSEAANPRLEKNGLQLIPNPNALFTERDTSIFLYGEIYNLTTSEQTPDEYSVAFTVLSSDGLPFRQLGVRSDSKPGESAVLAESFDIKDWPSGSYVLRVVVSDPETSQSDTTLSPFRIISRQSLFASGSKSTVRDPYDGLPLRVKMHLVEYLLMPEQRQTLESLTPEGKENYLHQYWQENDANRSTSIIENRQEMIERYNYSNEYFSTNEKQNNGWRTDRGRIYMTYGPWDDRDFVASPRSGDPFDIWYYDRIKEGKFFMFQDWSGTLDYRLVHSNVYGEVFDKELDESIKAGLLDIVR